MSMNYNVFKLRFTLTKVLLVFILSALYGTAYASDRHDNQKYYKQFQDIFEKVEKDYITEPDKKKMTDAAINGMLNSLDPHSMYFTDDELEDLLNTTKGEFGGIGVEILPDSGAMKVISPIEDLPADKAGIKAGDYILYVDGEAVSQLGYNKAVKRMRGTPGTKVKLSVFREGEKQTKDYEITRAIVKINPIKYHLDGDIAYIRITTFSEHTAHEMKQAMKAMIAKAKKPIKGIILDMRNNPGGILDQAVDVSEYFIDSGVIVTIKGRSANSHATFSASKFAAKAPNVPMVVLINGGTASCPEIVAGALQDYKRAVILGTKSFGKGSVQTLMQTGKNAAMKLTTAKYYTPHGRSIQADGIEPDIVIPQAKVEYPKTPDERKFSEASLSNHLKGDKEEKGSIKDALPHHDKKDAAHDNLENKSKDPATHHSETYLNDYQYARAYDLLLGLHLTHTAK